MAAAKKQIKSTSASVPSAGTTPNLIKIPPSASHPAPWWKIPLLTIDGDHWIGEHLLPSFHPCYLVNSGPEIIVHPS